MPAAACLLSYPHPYPQQAGGGQKVRNGLFHQGVRSAIACLLTSALAHFEAPGPNYMNQIVPRPDLIGRSSQ
jgi:hypothetical protein